MRVFAILLVVASACGGGSSVPRELCAVCEQDEQCESGVCRMYGDGFRKCTLPCAVGQMTPECTSPSSGLCNGMGFCMCPALPMPGDADIDDGGFKDASTP